MSQAHMPFDQMEEIYDMLARTIDEVGVQRTPVFLAKLVVLLAHQLGDAEAVRTAIADARRDR